MPCPYPRPYCYMGWRPTNTSTLCRLCSEHRKTFDWLYFASLQSPSKVPRYIAYLTWSGRHDSNVQISASQMLSLTKFGHYRIYSGSCFRALSFSRDRLYSAPLPFFASTLEPLRRNWRYSCNSFASFFKRYLLIPMHSYLRSRLWAISLTTSLVDKTRRIK